MLKRCLMASMVLSAVAVVSPAEAQTATVESIIASEGVFAFSDGSSVFRFEKGGTFVLEPVGISGRTIAGTWKQTDSGRLTVVGQWSWVNGVSRTDDYRRMVIHISYHGEPAVKASGVRSVKVYPCYVVMEELVAVTKAEADKARR